MATASETQNAWISGALMIIAAAARNPGSGEMLWTHLGFGGAAVMIVAALGLGVDIGGKN